ncbi:calcium-binding protein [Desmonostoc muscorum CCALA 125]|nr:calcium-binding protein [Desmonostoc muscorum CCALA 125]
MRSEELLFSPLLPHVPSPQFPHAPSTADTTLDSSLFRLGTSATTSGDRFIYNQSTGNLFFDKDGVGGTAQVQIAQFSNLVMLTNANITVIA